MMYQWGRKDSFTFATSSIKAGMNIWETGKYPVKIYNSKSELIYQVDNGGSNSGRTPVGGMIVIYTPASSMMETIKKPNMFYRSTLISQVGLSKELWNYYWTSYSRGSDGKMNGWAINYPAWHNTYLDGYIVLRSKSIYDPCPYGYRIPTNGTYNSFISNSGWTHSSYAGGTVWIKTWIMMMGNKSYGFAYIGIHTFYCTGIYSSLGNYTFVTNPTSNITNNVYNHSYGYSVRCIEDATEI